MNDETIKFPRLAVVRLKAVYLVLSGLVEMNAVGRFGEFKVSI